MRPLSALGLLLFAWRLAAQEPTGRAAASSALAASAEASVTPTPAPPRTPTPKPIGAGGSSLADIARRQKEQREREGKKASLGVISNETLRKGSPAGEPSPPKGGARPKATPPPAAPAAVAGPAPIPEWRDAKGRTEADWKKTMSDVRQRIAATEERVKTLEADARRYENDFYAWSDGNYRERVIRPAWDQAREELGRARKDLDAARSQLSELEEDARRSNAPPGWLR